MDKIPLNCSCLILGDYKTNPKSIYISDKGWFMDLNSVNKQKSVDIWISQADILKMFAYLDTERSYVFIDLNEKKCSNVQEQIGMKNDEHTINIQSESESQKRVTIVLDNVVDVCHNILRQRFRVFHELEDKTTAEKLFNYAYKTNTTPKRKESRRAGNSQYSNDPTDNHSSDRSFESSQFQQHKSNDRKNKHQAMMQGNKELVLKIEQSRQRNKDIMQENKELVLKIEQSRQRNKDMMQGNKELVLKIEQSRQRNKDMMQENRELVLKIEQLRQRNKDLVLGIKQLKNKQKAMSQRRSELMRMKKDLASINRSLSSQKEQLGSNKEDLLTKLETIEKKIAKYRQESMD